VTGERRVWAAFFALAIIWGSSFLFIKVALQTLQPVTLVSFRLLFGWLGLLVILWLQRLPFPRDRTLWRHLLVMALINVAIPFNLITWAESGQNGIDSGVASVLNSTVPLFSVVISGFMLRAETVTVATIGGLLVGFGGVVLLVGPTLGADSGSLAPYIAMVLSAICYAASSAYARRYLRGRAPVVVSFGQLLLANIIVVVFALVLEDFQGQSMTWTTLGALLWLGLLGSCAAYVFYFLIIQQWGATRATLVTYLIPIVGVTAGFVLLDEALDWRLLVGGLLILAGVGVVNRWRSVSRVLITARSEE
jgi:drug/metabolite transporter (DMT)-like permease